MITFYRHRNLDTISYCRDHHLNCTGLPDGIYEQPPERFDPHYVVCLRGREIGEVTCPTDPIWQEKMYIFNGKCTSRYAIPISYDRTGLLPDCSGKADGH